MYASFEWRSPAPTSASAVFREILSGFTTGTPSTSDISSATPRNPMDMQPSTRVSARSSSIARLPSSTSFRVVLTLSSASGLRRGLPRSSHPD